MNLANYRTVIKLLNLSCDVREISYFGKYNYSYDLVNTVISALDVILKDISVDSKLEKNSLHLNSFNNIISKEIDVSYKKKLQAINDKLKIISVTHNCIFVIHGSLGDGNYIKGWSDVDIICFIPDTILKKQQLLMNFRKSCEGLWELMLDVCPFQHHGILFLPKSFTKYYENSLMPLQAFKKGCLINSSNTKEIKLNVMTNFNPLEIINSLKLRLKIGEEAIQTRLYKHHGKNGIFLNIDYKNKSNNMYQLFSLMSYLMLVPSLMYTSINKPCYKANSFKKLDQYFSKQSLLFINLLSSIRKDWEVIYKFHDNEIPDWIINRLGKNFMEKGNNLIKESLKIFKDNQ
jgi:hypothetical protein